MKVFTTVNPKNLLNIYIITDNDQKSGVIIDPGDFSMNVYKLIKYIGADIKKVIITHNDVSKTAGVAVIKKIFDVEIFSVNYQINEYESIKIKNGSIIKEGNLEFKVIETPAHTFDSISVLIGNALFVGDILQAGYLSSLGSNAEPSEFELKVVENNIMSLPDNTIIYPSFGPATTVKIEKKFNPYLGVRNKNV
ncbi:MAG: MBL fold metallo-hydrolase [Spirochaetes bacterium]|nr:MBL fold metallo-hydrolase [Spirochaetota bacterium]